MKISIFHRDRYTQEDLNGCSKTRLILFYSKFNLEKEILKLGYLNYAQRDIL